MAQSKHTAGPWSAVNNPSSNYGLEVVADVKVKAKRVVCRVSGPDREANARLIAAAPELLAALKQARICLCDTARDRAAKSAIDAAIAKATTGGAA